jgi:hypothetical protein
MGGRGVRFRADGSRIVTVAVPSNKKAPHRKPFPFAQPEGPVWVFHWRAPTRLATWRSSHATCARSLQARGRCSGPPHVCGVGLWRERTDHFVAVVSVGKRNAHHPDRCTLRRRAACGKNLGARPRSMVNTWNSAHRRCQADCLRGANPARAFRLEWPWTWSSGG